MGRAVGLQVRRSKADVTDPSLLPPPPATGDKPSEAPWGKGGKGGKGKGKGGKGGKGKGEGGDGAAEGSAAVDVPERSGEEQVRPAAWSAMYVFLVGSTVF